MEWRNEELWWAEDPRHVKRILEDTAMKECYASSVPGVKPQRRDGDDDELRGPYLAKYPCQKLSAQLDQCQLQLQLVASYQMMLREDMQEDRGAPCKQGLQSRGMCKRSCAVQPRGTSGGFQVLGTEELGAWNSPAL